MAVAGYLRVSTAGQDTSTQRAALERAAGLRGDVIGVWHTETVSGAAARRPELEALLDGVRRGVLRRVYVFRLDRLSRRGAQALLELVGEFRRVGCELISVGDGFDLHGPAVEIVVAVLGWLAEQEREATRERVAAARRRLSSQGRAWGRPKRLKTSQIEEVKRLAVTRTVRAVAAALKIPRSTVGRILSQKPPPEGQLRPSQKRPRKNGSPPRPKSTQLRRGTREEP